MTESRYAVVGCTDCTEHWVVEAGPLAVDARECPRCGRVHQAHLLKQRVTWDSREKAAEARAEILAEKRDASDEFADVEHYAILEEHWNEDTVGKPLGLQVLEGEFRSDGRLDEDGRDDQDDDVGVDAGGDEDLTQPAARLRVDGESGLWLTRQAPAETSGRVTIGADSRPSDVWSELVDELEADFAIAVRELVGGVADGAAWQTLDELVDDRIGAVDADVLEDAEELRGSAFTATVLSLCHPRSDPRHQQALDFLRNFAEGEFSPMGQGFNPGIEDIRRCIKPLLAESAHTPTIAVRLDESFRSRRVEQQRTIVRLLSWLGHGVDVQLLFDSPIWMRRFAWTFDPEIDVDGLEGNVDDVAAFNLSSQASTGGRDEATRDDLVAEALEALDEDGEVVATLQRIDEQPGQTAGYEALRRESPWDGEQARQNVAHHLRRLREYELVTERIVTSDGSKVAIRPAGEALLREIGASELHQKGIDEFVSSAGNTNSNLESTPADTRDPSAGWDRNRLPALHRIQPLSRAAYEAAVSASPENGVTALDASVTEWDDRAAPRRFMDWEEDRLAVATEVDNPMQWAVCIARVLGSEFVWENLLTDERFDDAGDFRRLFDEAREVLANSACLGWMSENGEEVETLDEYEDRMLEAVDDVCEMTKDMTHGEYREFDSRKAFRSSILSESLGIIGVMTRLLDFAGVDVLRIGRMPRFKEGFEDSDLESIAKFVGINSAIASKYGSASVYRQLFEDRDEVRRWALDVSVDAEDPFGEMLGSWCLVADYGDRHEQFAELLRNRLDSPRDLHNDAPELGVRVPVETSTSRDHYRQLLERLLPTKDLYPTSEAVSVLHGLTRSPFAAAQGIERALKGGNDGRPIRSVELRRIIATLSLDQVLREASSTPRKALVALANADEEIIQTELAERAGVSARSLRDHLSDLVDAGVVAKAEDGYRLQLSFEETDTDGDAIPERYRDVLPRWVADPEMSPDVHAAAGALRAARRHHGTGDPPDEDDVGFAGDVLLELRDPDPWLDEVLPALWGLEARDVYRDDVEILGADAGAATDQSVMGVSPRQTSLQEAADGGVSA